MSTGTTFNLYTATAEELAAHIDQDMRKKEDNALKKRRELSDLKFRLSSDGQLMLNVIDFEGRRDKNGRWTPETVAAHRRYVQAQIDWIEKNPGDDLTPARVEFWINYAREDLPRCAELAGAVSWVKEVEEYQENNPEVKMSATLRKLNAKLEETVNDCRRHMASALSWPDHEFLLELWNRTYRAKIRFRLMDTRGYREKKVWQLRDVMIRGRVLFGFEHSIRHARTLSEVKRICEIWHAPIKVETRDGSKFVVGEGFEVIPQ